MAYRGSTGTSAVLESVKHDKDHSCLKCRRYIRERNYCKGYSSVIYSTSAGSCKRFLGFGRKTGKSHKKKKMKMR